MLKNPNCQGRSPGRARVVLVNSALVMLSQVFTRKRYLWFIA